LKAEKNLPPLRGATLEDIMAASFARKAMIEGGHRVVDRLVTFCGALFTTWDVSFDEAGGVDKIKDSPDTYHIHALMKVRRA
jgi:hypothetical protein